MLAMHPEYQKKVYEEIINVLPNGQTTVTANAISQLSFTDRLIKETLRLFPTIPMITRITREDMKIGKNCYQPFSVTTTVFHFQETITFPLVRNSFCPYSIYIVRHQFGVAMLIDSIRTIFYPKMLHRDSRIHLYHLRLGQEIALV